MTFPPDRCPLCGESNACGNVAGRASCWCQTTTIPRSVLERLPDDAVNVACVCARCAAELDRPSPLRVLPDRDEPSR